MDIKTLSHLLHNHFDWHPARINTLSQSVFALIMTGSVNLKHLAQGFQNDALLHSSIRRLQRFFKEQSFDFHLFGVLIYSFSSLGKKKVCIALDRTNWDFGIFPINFLFITIVWGKISIPIVWSLLGKEGNSNTLERIDLMRKFLKIIPASQILCFLGDREFIGKEWFNFLNENKIPFAMRIKSSTKVRHSNGGSVPIKNLFYGLKIHEYLQIDTQIWGIKVQISGMKLRDGKFLIIASPQKLTLNILETYRERWAIERTFLCLKTKGFNFERTHLKENDKLLKLMAVAVLAFVISVKIGAFREEEKSIPIKKHGRPLYTIFTYGLDWLRFFLLKNQKPQASSLLTTMNQFFTTLLSIPPYPFLSDDV
jgi:hypothetical protein